MLKGGRPDNVMNLGGNGGAQDPLLQFLCGIARQIVERLDSIDRGVRGIAIEEGEGSTIYAEKSIGDLGIPDLIEYTRLALASMPTQHQVVALSTSPEVVIDNSNPDPVAMLITNEDNALVMRYGSDTVTATNGAILPPETSMKVIIPANTKLYAILPSGTASIGVAKLELPKFS